jgi:RimJ/RimL family protein N-acetyltransferase
VGVLTVPSLTTARLRLEPVVAEHLELMVELNSDPEVMRFIIGRAAGREEVLAEWAERRGPRTDAGRGLGYWAGFADAEFVGWWGLAATDEAGVANLGYRLRRAAWGEGYATEGAGALLAHGFGILSLHRVCASTMAVNTGSRTVLEKLGMTHTETCVGEWRDPLPGWELGEVVYEITAAAHARARSARRPDPRPR